MQGGTVRFGEVSKVAKAVKRGFVRVLGLFGEGFSEAFGVVEGKTSAKEEVTTGC